MAFSFLIPALFFVFNFPNKNGLCCKCESPCLHWFLNIMELPRSFLCVLAPFLTILFFYFLTETSAPATKMFTGGSFERDVALAEVEKEKRSSFIKAWEESEKTKVDNKAQKKLSAVAAWENTKKAGFEAKLKQMEEQLEKKKAEYGEKMKNKVAGIHKEAAEKKATVEAQRAEQILKAEETAAKYRTTGQIPKKLLGCF